MNNESRTHYFKLKVPDRKGLKKGQYPQGLQWFFLGRMLQVALQKELYENKQFWEKNQEFTITKTAEILKVKRHKIYWHVRKGQIKANRRKNGEKTILYVPYGEIVRIIQEHKTKLTSDEIAEMTGLPKYTVEHIDYREDFFNRLPSDPLFSGFSVKNFIPDETGLSPWKQFYSKFIGKNSLYPPGFVNDWAKSLGINNTNMDRTLLQKMMKNGDIKAVKVKGVWRVDKEEVKRIENIQNNCCYAQEAAECLEITRHQVEHLLKDGYLEKTKDILGSERISVNSVIELAEKGLDNYFYRNARGNLCGYNLQKLCEENYTGYLARPIRQLKIVNETEESKKCIDIKQKKALEMMFEWLKPQIRMNCYPKYILKKYVALAKKIELESNFNYKQIFYYMVAKNIVFEKELPEEKYVAIVNELNMYFPVNSLSNAGCSQALINFIMPMEEIQVMELPGLCDQVIGPKYGEILNQMFNWLKPQVDVNNSPDQILNKYITLAKKIEWNSDFNYKQIFYYMMAKNIVFNEELPRDDRVALINELNMYHPLDVLFNRGYSLQTIKIIAECNGIEILGLPGLQDLVVARENYVNLLDLCPGKIV